MPTVVPMWCYRATAELPWSLWCPVSLGATVVTLRSLLWSCSLCSVTVSLWCYSDGYVVTLRSMWSLGATVVPKVVPVLTLWCYRVTAVLLWSLWCAVSLRCHRSHSEVILMSLLWSCSFCSAFWCNCGHSGATLVVLWSP